MHDFLHRLGPQDRVLLVGDVRQHQAVEAGRPYQQLQEAGIETVRLDDIVRQQDPALKQVVEQLSRGEVRGAIQRPRAAGARARNRRPRRSGSPPSRTPTPETRTGRWSCRRTISHGRRSTRPIHRADAGHRPRPGSRAPAHASSSPARTSPARTANGPRSTSRGTSCATRRAARRSASHAGEYARVDAGRRPGQPRHGRRARAASASPTTRAGSRASRSIARRSARSRWGTACSSPRRTGSATWRIVSSARSSRSTPAADCTCGSIQGAPWRSPLKDHPHLDYGYAVTSHSSQGQTADRVLVHVDTERGGEPLVNRRLAYVAVSRGRFDAQIYTDDTAQLGDALSREVSHRSAIEPSRAPVGKHGRWSRRRWAVRRRRWSSRDRARASPAATSHDATARGPGVPTRVIPARAPGDRKWSPLAFALDRLFPKRGRAPYATLERLVVLVVIRAMSPDGDAGEWNCFLSYPTIARWSGMSVASVKRMLQRHCDGPAPLFFRSRSGQTRGHRHACYRFTLVRHPEQFAAARDAARADRRKVAQQRCATSNPNASHCSVSAKTSAAR